MNFHESPFIYPGEVCLQVTNLDQSHRFYTDIIGFNTLEEKGNSITYTTDGKQPLLTIIQPNDVKKKAPHTTGLYHFALLLPNRMELGRMLVHLLQKKVQLGAADHAVSEALYLSDPDGNGIELYADRDSSGWQWNDGEVHMTTDELNGKDLLAAGVGRLFRRLPADTKMGHIHLHVDNLITAMKFYATLGFDVVSRYPQALFLSNGAYHHHIAINTWNGTGAEPPAPNAAGLEHYTLIYPDEQAVEQVINKLDTQPEYADDTLRIQDPAGNWISIKTS